MDAPGVGSLSPPALAIAALLVSVILITVIKLGWGMAQWTKKSEHRVGERWGSEHVEVVEWTGTEGYVRASGELWRARSKEELFPGDQVKGRPHGRADVGSFKRQSAVT